MEVSTTLSSAWKAVEEADLPEKVHKVAFREAVRLLRPPEEEAQTRRPAARPHGGSRGSGSGGGSKSGDPGIDDIVISESALLGKVAEGTNCDQVKLEQLVHLDEGALRISLPGIQLGSNNADKTRTIAKVFSVVRAFGLDEEGASVESIRSEAQRLKCYDSTNFTKQLAKLAPQFVIAGSATKEVRPKNGGINAFAELVETLVGEV